MRPCQLDGWVLRISCAAAVLAVAMSCRTMLAAPLFEDNFNYSGAPDSGKWNYGAAAGSGSSVSISANGIYADFDAAGGDAWAYIKSKSTFAVADTTKTVFEYRRDASKTGGQAPQIIYGNNFGDSVWSIEVSWDNTESKDKVLFESIIGGVREVRAVIWLNDSSKWYRIEMTNSGTDVTARIFDVGGSQVDTTKSFTHDAMTGDRPIYFKIGVGSGQSGDGTSFDLDNVQVIPEPVTMAILGLGGIGMLIRRGR